MERQKIQTSTLYGKFAHSAQAPTEADPEEIGEDPEDEGDEEADDDEDPGDCEEMA